MMGFEEQLKKHAKNFNEIRKPVDEANTRLVQTWKTREDPKKLGLELQALLEKKEWVRVEDAVAEYNMHAHNKAREKLQKLLENRPRLKKACCVVTIPDVFRQYHKENEAFLEELEELTQKK